MIQSCGPHSVPSFHFFIIIITVPGPVEVPSVISVNRTSAELEWEEPDDPNGVILEYVIEYTALRFAEEPYQERKRQIDELLQTCFDHLSRNDTVINVKSSNKNGRIENLRKIRYFTLQLNLLVSTFCTIY